jgi:effector-binding domain-containing protein
MGHYTVERSIQIEATQEKIIEHLVDFREWKVWSPWVILDPATLLSYEGRAGEVGSYYRWESDYIGSGQMVLNSVENGVMKTTLSFFKPWKSESNVTYSVVPTDEGCEVTWSMESTLPWFMFWMKKQMIAWIGSDFERGLKLFKEYVETGSIAMELCYEGVVKREAMPYIGLKNQGYLHELGDIMSADFEKLHNHYLPTPQSTFFAMTTKADLVKQHFSFISAISDSTYTDTDAKESYVKGEIPSCEAIKVTLKGSYDYLGNAWAMAMTYQRGLKRKPLKGVLGYEVYINNPHEVAPEELITELYIPLR